VTPRRATLYLGADQAYVRVHPCLGRHADEGAARLPSGRKKGILHRMIADHLEKIHMAAPNRRRFRTGIYPLTLLGSCRSYILGGRTAGKRAARERPRMSKRKVRIRSMQVAYHAIAQMLGSKLFCGLPRSSPTLPRAIAAPPRCIHTGASAKEARSRGEQKAAHFLVCGTLKMIYSAARYTPGPKATCGSSVEFSSSSMLVFCVGRRRKDSRMSWRPCDHARPQRNHAARTLRRA